MGSDGANGAAQRERTMTMVRNASRADRPSGVPQWRLFFRLRFLMYWAAVVPCALLLAACGGGYSSPPSRSVAPSGTTTDATPSASAERSPDESLPLGRVIFDRYRGGPEGTYLDTFVLDASGPATKLDIPFAAVERRAVWSPDGTKLLVNSWSWETGGSVGTFDLATGAFSPMNPGLTGDFICTDWAPDGASVICSLSSTTEADDGIYTVDLSDGSVTRVTHAEFHFVEGSDGACGGGESRAVYAPDGSRFAYQQQKCGTGPDPSADEQGNIVVADADGSNPHTVVPFGGVLTHPGGEISWSPTADVIAFGTPDGHLSVVNADGSGLRTITVPVPGYVFGPAWSPDGTWILVCVDAGAGADLYAVASDSSRAIHLTDEPDFEIYTDWADDAP